MNPYVHLSIDPTHTSSHHMTGFCNANHVTSILCPRVPWLSVRDAFSYVRSRRVGESMRHVRANPADIVVAMLRQTGMGGGGSLSQARLDALQTTTNSFYAYLTSNLYLPKETWGDLAEPSKTPIAWSKSQASVSFNSNPFPCVLQFLMTQLYFLPQH